MKPALGRVEGKVHAFYSNRDDVWLKWRTSTFGTYDNIKSVAAGHVGFALKEPTEKVVQHAYRAEWDRLGNPGTHGGALARAFAREMIGPVTVGKELVVRGK